MMGCPSSKPLYSMLSLIATMRSILWHHLGSLLVHNLSVEEGGPVKMDYDMHQDIRVFFDFQLRIASGETGMGPRRWSVYQAMAQ